MKVVDEVTGTAESDILGMKNWSDEKQCWMGVICQIRKDESGNEFIQIYDVKSAELQVQIDDWIKESIATKPWEK